MSRGFGNHGKRCAPGINREQGSLTKATVSFFHRLTVCSQLSKFPNSLNFKMSIFGGDKKGGERETS